MKSKISSVHFATNMVSEKELLTSPGYECRIFPLKEQVPRFGE